MMTDLKSGDEVKLVVSMIGTVQTIQMRSINAEGRIELLVNGNWYYADTGCACNKSLAYIGDIKI
jgi:hypothetical protein